LRRLKKREKKKKKKILGEEKKHQQWRSKGGKLQTLTISSKGLKKRGWEPYKERATTSKKAKSTSRKKKKRENGFIYHVGSGGKCRATSKEGRKQEDSASTSEVQGKRGPLGGLGANRT